MATLQQVHIILQQLHKQSEGTRVAINTITELLQKTPESVQTQVQLLNDLGFAIMSKDGHFVSLTETGLLANVELHHLR